MFKVLTEMDLLLKDSERKPRKQRKESIGSLDLDSSELGAFTPQPPEKRAVSHNNRPLTIKESMSKQAFNLKDS